MELEITSQMGILKKNTKLFFFFFFWWAHKPITCLSHLSFPSLLSVCFKVFDVDRDGVLSRDELHEMVVALLEVWKDNRTDTLPVSPARDAHVEPGGSRWFGASVS